jgi:hypothetical protein
LGLGRKSKQRQRYEYQLGSHKRITEKTMDYYLRGLLLPQQKKLLRKAQQLRYLLHGNRITNVPDYPFQRLQE